MQLSADATRLQTGQRTQCKGFPYPTGRELSTLRPITWSLLSRNIIL